MQRLPRIDPADLRPRSASYRPADATYERAAVTVEVPDAAPLGRADFDPPPAAPVDPLDVPALVVVRGRLPHKIYPLRPGPNVLGRKDGHRVDVCLADQEEADQIWMSRQHLRVVWEGGMLTVQDMKSLNGTFLNGERLTANHCYRLEPRDLIQIGTLLLVVHVPPALRRGRAAVRAEGD